jgi:hypothetical protein
MKASGMASDERGLIGKILVLWLVLGILLVVFAYDGIQVAVTRFRVADAAQTAAFEASATLRSTQGDRAEAYQAALAAVEEEGSSLRLVEFSIDPQSGQVTVTVTHKASTLLMGRIGFLKSLTKARATETSELPPP